MSTDESQLPIAPEPNWASYIDTLKITALSRRLKESGLAATPSVTGEKKNPTEPISWADYIDRLYMDQLMRSLDRQ